MRCRQVQKKYVGKILTWVNLSCTARKITKPKLTFAAPQNFLWMMITHTTNGHIFSKVIFSFSCYFSVFIKVIFNFPILVNVSV